MIKVCHITSAHRAEDLRIFRKECASLAKAGYDVYLVERGESTEKMGVHIVGTGEMPEKRFLRMTLGTRRVYKKALELDCDIYHFHDPELLPYGLKLKKSGKKVIFDCHENTVGQILEKGWLPGVMRKLISFSYRLYQRYVCKKLDAVVSPHYQYDYFAKINPKTFIIANYPILMPLPHDVVKNGKRICFIGGIDKRWCHDKIIKALENVTDCQYVMCGKDWDHYIDELKKLPAWSKVSYKGYLPQDEVYKILVSSAVGLVVSTDHANMFNKQGTLGLVKIFEEMMAGLPIVCSDFTVWRDIVERWHCGICVDPENVGDISAAIKYLLDNPEEAKSMGENGRRAVETEFNWQSEEKKLLELYEDLSSDIVPRI